MNPALAAQANLVIDSHLAAGLIQHFPPALGKSPVIIPETDGGIRITVSYKTP